MEERKGVMTICWLSLETCRLMEVEVKGKREIEVMILVNKPVAELVSHILGLVLSAVSSHP